MTNNDLALSFARIAQEAGRVILAIRDRVCRTGAKSDGSPVTDADLAAEEIVLRGLQALLPSVPVISEEAAIRPVLASPLAEFLLVDPLDGTREFVAGRPEFTVNIALIRDRRPVAGTVYAPALGDLYLGGEDASYGVLDALQPLEQVHLSMVHARKSESTPSLAVSRSHLDLETKAYIERYPGCGRVDIGSSLKFGMIARGVADIYPRFSATMEWDTAAGHAILNAAGGSVKTPDGQAFLYGKIESGFRNGPFIASGISTHTVAH